MTPRSIALDKGDGILGSQQPNSIRLGTEEVVPGGGNHVALPLRLEVGEGDRADALIRAALGASQEREKRQYGERTPLRP